VAQIFDYVWLGFEVLVFLYRPIGYRLIFIVFFVFCLPCMANNLV